MRSRPTHLDGVLADRQQRVGLPRAAVRDGVRPIDVAGRKRDDAALGESLADERRERSSSSPRSSPAGRVEPNFMPVMTDHIGASGRLASWSDRVGRSEGSTPCHRSQFGRSGPAEARHADHAPLDLPACAGAAPSGPVSAPSCRRRRAAAGRPPAGPASRSRPASAR